MPDMLAPIVAATRRRIAAMQDRAEAISAAAAAVAVPSSFEEAMRRPGLSVIAEVKRASPSAGPIAPDLDPGRLAEGYASGGAAAISVLTEPEFFRGSLDDLAAVTGTVSVPVLRKDFVLDPIQITEARAAGAAAVLLIVAILDPVLLGELVSCAEDHGLAALVEAHDEAEVQAAAAAGARIIGVNNRNLETFTVDLSTAERVRPVIPDSVVAIAESGIGGPDDARRMAAAGYDAVLVGQAAAQAPDPAAYVTGLIRAAS
jgi:indole-3-glycerol phosphate synthase